MSGGVTGQPGGVHAFSSTRSAERIRNAGPVMAFFNYRPERYFRGDRVEVTTADGVVLTGRVTDAGTGYYSRMLVTLD